MTDLQTKFEELATKIGCNTRKEAAGDYSNEYTARLWRWYSAGAEAGSCIDVLHLADPNFMMSDENK